MYVGNVRHVEELNSLIVQELRNIGIKYRLKKSNLCKSNHDNKLHLKDTKVFKRSLSTLKTHNVILKSGVTVEIPVFVVEACNHIKQRCDLEGIFRKAGSAARLREIKAVVDNGKQIDLQYHVIDISNILKLFFRELPEPLFPFIFHDLLLRCLLLKERAIEGILLACLLFPLVHLNTLAYIMEFFQEVANHENSNKMGITNLAIVLTPSLMPVEEKIIVNSSTRLTHHVRVIELLMQNTERIGVLPESLVEKALNVGCIAPASEDVEWNEEDASKSKKKKKRRSGSLTRMINGLKKMVGKGSPEINDEPSTSTPDFSSPCLKSSKKRKIHESSGAFSSKKKREILQALPQSVTLANAPLTPLPGAVRELHFTPRVNSNPKLVSSKSESRLKSRLNVGRKSGKKLKKGASTSTDQTSPNNSRHSDKASRSSAEWQWKSGPWRRKKCLSSSDTPVFTGDFPTQNQLSDSVFCSDSTASCTASVFDAGVDLSDTLSSSDTEFVKISKSEYEDIKNRVSAIENRISQEFGCIASNPSSLQDIPLIDESDEEICSAKKVQEAYEKTLEESEKLGDPLSTDQLAKRLSRELKIRHSFDNKIIRSPSARKIGTIRRRSRESARNSLGRVSKNNSPKGVVRHASLRQQTCHVSNQEQVFYPKINLRRGRPNTVFSGLPHPSPRIPVSTGIVTPKANLTSNIKSLDNSDASLHENFVKSGRCVNSTPNEDQVQCVVRKDESFKTPLKGHSLSLEGGSDEPFVRRTSSFHGTELLNSQKCDNNPCDVRKSRSEVDISSKAPVGKGNTHACKMGNTSNVERWQNAPHYFKKPEVQDIPVSGRESVVKIRNQNAGMVLARMRLFDKKQDPNGTPSRERLIQTGSERRGKHSIPTNPHSLRVQCIQNLTHKNSPATGERRRSICLHSSLKDSVGSSLSFRGSPKKIGSPRKKYLSQKSPKTTNKKLKPKASKSPQKEKQSSHTGNERSLRKFNSLRETSNRSPFTSKGNVTAPPSVLDFGKENLTSTNNYSMPVKIKIGNDSNEKNSEILQHIHLPDNLKETIYDVCTPKIDNLGKMSVSPLKDCNRIDINAPPQFDGNRSKTPKNTPYIKKPLFIKSPADYSRTPYGRTPVPDAHSQRLTTPLKALPIITSIHTPIIFSRSSPQVVNRTRKLKS